LWGCCQGEDVCGPLALGRVGGALGDGDTAGGEVGGRNLAQDDPHGLPGGVEGIDGRVGEVADEVAQPLRGASLDHGHLDERHDQAPASPGAASFGAEPPLRNTEPSEVKCIATADPGGAKTASVMPPVSTIQPTSMACPRRARSLAASASASPGWPWTAAPVAESTITPSTSTRTASVARSRSLGGRPIGPLTNAPEEA